MKNLKSSLKKSLISFVAFTTILWSLSGLLLAPIQVHAGDGISSITGEDLDNASFGINGNDFYITWATLPSDPAGFNDSMQLFILPFDAEVTAANVLVDFCDGSACNPLRTFAFYGADAFTLSEAITQDSDGDNFDADVNYKACLYIDATTDTLDCSSAINIEAEEAGDIQNEAPFIDHMSAHSYVTGSGFTVYAVVDDDITSSFSAGDVKMMHNSANGTATLGAEQNGTLLSGTDNVWEFAVSGSFSTNNFLYYLKATDGGGLTRYFSADPSVTDEAGAIGSPLSASPVDADTKSVTGTVCDNSSGDNIGSGTRVFLNGLAWAGGADTTDGDGVYTFSNIPAGSYDITAAATSYCESTAYESVFGTREGADIYLNPGTCSHEFDDGGGTGQPHVIFSGPPDFDWNVPLNEIIRVGFDQPLNAATVADDDASNDNSNVYLTTDGSTKLEGRVIYCTTYTSPGCSDYVFDADNNTLVFLPPSGVEAGANWLTANTFYTLVITAGVTGDSGQSVMGSRPSGGHEISFTTGGGTDFSTGAGYDTLVAQHGSGGAYMPPFVESVAPGPGMPTPPNGNFLVKFNETMDTNTLTTTNIKLLETNGTSVPTSLTIDTNTRDAVIINPDTNLEAGEYEIQILGAVASSAGVTMRPPNESTSSAFSTFVNISGAVDGTGPTLYPMIADGTTEVPSNTGFLEYGASEQLDPTTVTTSNITLQRGTTAVSISLDYDPGDNRLFIIPSNALAVNTTYTITFSTSVTDLNAQALSPAQTYTFTTGAREIVEPGLVDARCDDYACEMFFTEPPINDAITGSDWANSAINIANWTLENTTAAATINLTGLNMTYNPIDFSVRFEGINDPANWLSNQNFRVTAAANIQDLSGNTIDADSRVFNGTIESSAETYGDFGGGGMFGPPMSGGMTGGEFAPQGFGSFTAEEFMFGGAVNAYPFNPMAGQDVNVFQISLPWEQLSTTRPTSGDKLVFTFPAGTTIANAKPDEFSPFYADFNEFGPGTITFDSTYDGDGVAVNTTTREVTVQLAVSGSNPTPSDYLTVDLRGITNPSIPRGPESGGYTVEVKLIQSSITVTTVESTPYYINEGGSRSITFSIYAGSSGTPDSVSGDVFLFAGGPAGPMDKNVHLLNGEVDLVDGTAATNVALTNLPDGCYFYGTDPFITLGATDYFGADVREPVCVDASNPTATPSIVLTNATTSATAAELTVKIVKSGGFSGTDIDIFAGGPGRFVVKTVSAAIATQDAGHTLYLPTSGMWHVGIGPAMSKSASGGMPDFDAFGGTPPPPYELSVSGTDIKPGWFNPPGVDFSDANDTLEFTVQSADISVPVKVTDDINANLANVEVFMHQRGFGQGTFGMTNASGEKTLNVASYGKWEICAHKWGLGETCKDIEIKDDGSNTIYSDGSAVNPVSLKIFKPDYTISGKLLDADGNSVGNAPIWASSNNGQNVFTMTDTDGSYSIFVAAGTWTIKADLPPDKTNICGVWSKEVIVSSTTGNKSNQNISPTSSDCYTVNVTLDIGGSSPSGVFVHAFDEDSGFFRGAVTNSSGVANMELIAGDYDFGFFHPDYGEAHTTGTVDEDNEAISLATGTLANITFAFTGGATTTSGFIEVKNASDSNVRMSKSFTDASSNITLSVPEGTYNYNVEVFGYGGSRGSVATGGTVTTDVSDELITISGKAYDTATPAVTLTNAMVALDNFNSNIHRDDKTDTTGAYSIQIKPGTYEIVAFLNGYVSGAPASITLTEDTTYNFGGAEATQTGLTEATDTIAGTIYEAANLWEDAGTPEAAEEAFVWAKNTVTGDVVGSPIDETTGAYTLPVTEGSWQIKTVGPLHDETTLPGSVDTSDDAADTGKDITMTYNANKAPIAVQQTLDATTGGTVDKTATADMKLTAAAGVLESQGNVTVSMEKSYAAPADKTYEPLDDVSYDLTVSNSSQTITSFSGNAELTLEYSDANLPNGVNEANLVPVYLDNGQWIPCEGGSAIDTVNNAITCITNHATKFSVVYAASLVSAPGSRRNRHVQPPSGLPDDGEEGEDEGEGDDGDGTETTDAEGETTEEGETVDETAEETASEPEVIAEEPVVNVVPERAATPDLAKETLALGEFSKLLSRTPVDDNDWLVVNYLTYGTKTVAKVHMNERRNLLNEYKESYGHLPQTEAEWTNLDKISKGEDPTIRNLDRESTGLKSFTETYDRLPASDSDWNFVRWVSYKLRIVERDLDKERKSIGDFRGSHGGRLPVSQNDWAVVRALAYGEATSVK